MRCAATTRSEIITVECVPQCVGMPEPPTDDLIEITIRDAGPAAGAVVIGLDRDFFQRTARETLGTEASVPDLHRAAADPFIRELGLELRAGSQAAQHDAGAAYLEALAAVLAVHLARNHCGTAAVASSRTGLAPHQLDSVQAYIHTHVDQPLHLQNLARMVHMSPWHFARSFKQATGWPPHLYITRQRMEYAKELLHAGVMPLVDVAARAGYQTQSHFTTVFRRFTGSTPRQFRLNGSR